MSNNITSLFVMVGVPLALSVLSFLNWYQKKTEKRTSAKIMLIFGILSGLIALCFFFAYIAFSNRILF